MKPAKPKKPETTGQGDQDIKPAVEGPSSIDNGKYKMFNFTQLFMKLAKPKKPETTADQEAKPVTDEDMSVGGMNKYNITF